MTINRGKGLLTIPVRFDGEAVKPSEIATEDIGKKCSCATQFYKQSFSTPRNAGKIGRKKNPARQVRTYFMQNKTRREGNIAYKFNTNSTQ